MLSHDTVVFGEPFAGTTADDDLAADVREGLTGRPKRLPAKYLYDALGSQLFEAICYLPWYHPTRAEFALLRAHASEIAGALPEPESLIELGCGNGAKLALLAESIPGPGPIGAHLIDISAAALDLSARTLSPMEHLAIDTHCCAYEEGLARVARLRRSSGGHALALFLGSSIGNFDPRDADALLGQIRCSLRPGDLFLLGADLVKPESTLLQAYDDPLGVTAAFNRNVLVRLNRELGSTFDLATFTHQARWNASASRVEMHLVSRVRQSVEIPGAACLIELEAGESIWTESSYKYDTERLRTKGERAGFAMHGQWIDRTAGFALSLFRIP